MPTLNIKDAEAHRLASELARRTGETLTAAVKQAVRERLARTRGRPGQPEREAARWLEMARAIADAPELDPRPAEEILGYSEIGR